MSSLIEPTPAAPGNEEPDKLYVKTEEAADKILYALVMLRDVYREGMAREQPWAPAMGKLIVQGNEVEHSIRGLLGEIDPKVQ